MKKEKNLSVVERFKKILAKNFSFNKLILFGSRARGDFDEDSDFDLIIVSEEFVGVKSYKRLSQVRHYWDVNYPVDMVCLTSREFEKMKNSSTIIRLANNEGIEI